MLFNRTKDKATLSFLQVSKYWDGSFDRESLLPWTWLANMQVSHLSARPNHSVSNWILFLQAAPGPSPHLWPSSHALPLSNVLAWMPGLGGPCASSVLPQVTLQLTGHSPVDLPSSPQSFSPPDFAKWPLALNIEEYITCLYILNCLFFCLHETLHPVSSSSLLHPQSLDQCLWDCFHSINILLKAVILIF